MGIFDTKVNSQTNVIVPPEVIECDKQLTAVAQKKANIVNQIGKIYVDNNNAKTAAGTIFEPLMLELEKLSAEAITIEKRKLAVQGLRKCEKCGNILVLDSFFCNKCGIKLEELFASQKQCESICTQCGTPYGEESVFCTGCGKKLP